MSNANHDPTPIPLDERGHVEMLRVAARASEIEVRFTRHEPNEDQPGRFNLIHDMAKGFAKLIVTACPESRELSLALTALEECVMWATASIAHRE